MGQEISALFRRADHVSMTVKDVEASVSFYEKAFGSTVLYRMGPFDAAEIPPLEDGRDWSEAHVNVAGAKLTIVMVQLFDNQKLELFQYDAPEAASEEVPRNCDVGANHICIEVSNMEAALAHLSSLGCQILSGPIASVDGPCPDSNSWYVVDPFWHQLELVEYL